MTDTAPLGKISDWFYRVEYQQRGSPHVRMLIWLEDAPEFGNDSDAKVTSFIEKIITCQKPIDNLELLNLVDRQVHRHSHTCWKNTKSECRCNYLQPPMRQTQILLPLNSDMPQNEVKMHKDRWKSIKKHLSDIKDDQDTNISFGQLLLDLNVIEESYSLAVRSSPNVPSVFLKRNPNELCINNYNPACLSAWRANNYRHPVCLRMMCMHVLFTSWITYQRLKKEWLNFYNRLVPKQGNENCSIKQQVRDVGRKFVNDVEISAQEAVYIILQLPMRKASRQIIFINT